MARHAIGQPLRGVGQGVDDLARLRGAAQDVFKQRPVFWLHGGAGHHFLVACVAQHQPVIGIKNGQPIGQDIERCVQLRLRTACALIGLGNGGPHAPGCSVQLPNKQCAHHQRHPRRT